MNVAVIDRMLYAHSYLPLFREVSKIVKHNGRLLLYAPKNGGPKSGLGSTVVKHVWTPNFYPFQILRQALRDRLEIVHIQYELVTFGSLYTSLLFPLLLLFLKLIRVKVVITVHGIFPKSMIKHVLPDELPIPQIILKLYLVFTHKLIDLFGDALIVHSPSMKKIFLSEYKIKREIYVIPHGFDFEKHEDLSRMSLWESRLDGCRVILFFGYIAPRKGVTYLIRAFEQVARKYPDVRLVIAGDVRPYYKSYGEKVKSLSRELNLEDKIIFTGFVSERDVLALYSQCDIVALPYEPFIMGTSGTLALAVQNGKPVIATKIQYFEEELKDREDALLVPPQDVDHLAKGIEALLVDEELRSRISKNILCKAKERSWDTMARLTVDVYAKVMAEESRTQRDKAPHEANEDKLRSELKRYYNTFNAYFEDLRRRSVSMASLPRIERIISKNIRSDGYFVDVGSGSGDFVAIVAGITSGLCIGIEISKIGAVKGKELVNSRQLDNVEFVIADALKMPLKSSTVNLILCKSVLEHLINPAKAISEMGRVLEDSGTALITTDNFASPFVVASQHGVLWGAGKPADFIRNLIIFLFYPRSWTLFARLIVNQILHQRGLRAKPTLSKLYIGGDTEDLVYLCNSFEILRHVERAGLKTTYFSTFPLLSNSGLGLAVESISRIPLLRMIGPCLYIVARKTRQSIITA